MKLRRVDFTQLKIIQYIKAAVINHSRYLFNYTTPLSLEINGNSLPSSNYVHININFHFHSWPGQQFGFNLKLYKYTTRVTCAMRTLLSTILINLFVVSLSV